MYVISKDNDAISMLRRRTDVEVQSAADHGMIGLKHS